LITFAIRSLRHQTSCQRMQRKFDNDLHNSFFHTYRQRGEIKIPLRNVMKVVQQGNYVIDIAQNHTKAFPRHRCGKVNVWRCSYPRCVFVAPLCRQ
jgi:hypothetical protein